MKNTIKNLILKSNLILAFIITISLFACGPSNENKNTSDSEKIESQKSEVNKTLSDTSSTAATYAQKSLENYEAAKAAYLKNPNDPDALIWYGRRAAYLGEFEEAIEIYSDGIEKHPKDARIYRHRGHRYITLRNYDKAIADFEKATTLINGQEDQVETDGLPNERNIPLSTLHGNIWYHLGLAYYLNNDMDNALRAFSNRTVTEKYDDNIVSGGYWLYMINRRLGNLDEANAAIKEVSKDMDIIENNSYHKMCLFYKGAISEKELQPKSTNSPSDDVFSYGLGNWFLYHKKDTIQAKQYFDHLFKNGNKNSFAYIAAEADAERLFKK